MTIPDLRFGTHDRRVLARLMKRRYTPPSPTSTSDVTICIAAICDCPPLGGYGIVAISDRKFSMTRLAIGYEPRQSKYFAFSKEKMVLLAGQTAIQTVVCRTAAKSLESRPEATVAEVAEAFAEAFRAERFKRNTHTYLEPRGVTPDEFKHRRKGLRPALVKIIADELRDGYLDLQAIIAGVDPDGATPHVQLYYVGDPGEAECVNAQGYTVIGSGSDYAVKELAAHGLARGDPLSDWLYALYCAKVEAEQDDSVGKTTDVFCVGPNGQVPMYGDMSTILPALRARERGEGRSAVVSELTRVLFPDWAAANPVDNVL